MKQVLFFTGVFILFFNNQCTYSNAAQRQVEAAVKMKKIVLFYEKGMEELAIPQLQLSYKTNLENITKNGYSTNLVAQKAFYNNIINQLKSVKSAHLTQIDQINHGVLKFDSQLNIERITAETAFIEAKATPKEGGVFQCFNGKEYYSFLIKRWTGKDLTPDELLAFGEKEVERVNGEMEKIKNDHDDNFYDYIKEDHFFISNPDEVQHKFEEIRETVQSNLATFFPDYPALPEVKISRGTNKNLAKVPGYYSQNTFYYNIFDRPYNIRQYDWLFIHEGNPGHHYQINYERSLNLPAFRAYLRSSGYTEGWAAYVENLGEMVGLYQTPYDYLGKWEWDIVRSVRIVLDVRLNYYGWTKEQALAYWKSKIPNQDDIAMREIDRMLRWPAQVNSYKVGEGIIKELKIQEQKKLGEKFDLKAFHTKILSQGAIPVEVLNVLFE